MILSAKRVPTIDSLENAANEGFDHVELFLDTHHLDNLEATITIAREASIDVIAVHTPHVALSGREYFIKTGHLADALDAFVVFHSQFLHHSHVAELEELEITAPYGYENNPGASMRHFKHMIIDKGHNFVLDIAHLYMAESNYIEMSHDLIKEYPGKLQVIHLCDSTAHDDGLAFGDGYVNIEEISKIIKESYNGILVLEVDPERQSTARDKFLKY